MLARSEMAGSRMNKRLCLIGLTLLAAACYGWFRLLILTVSYDFHPRPVSHLVRFSPRVLHDFSWYQQECFGGTDEQLTMSKLEDFSGRWKVAQHPDCTSTYQKFTNIYSINRRSGQIVIPETFQTKILKWLGNDEELLKEAKLQFITSIFNQYTHENAVFNPLRSKRPGVAGDEEELDQYIETLVEQTQNCDFCDYKFKTAEDTFGRIESEHAVTAANAFKYEAYHALVILKTHHPLKFTEEQFVDLFDVAMKWFMKVYAMDKQYRYPQLMWDSLPKSSASQVHPHAQASLSPDRHYGLMEHIRLSALEYGHRNGGHNYFSDLIQIHAALGLTATLGEATAMAYLTPKKDHEVIILSKSANQDFVRLLFYTIRAFIDDMREYAWSLSVFLPKLEPYSSPGVDDIPAIARIISRGPAMASRNDISSMELFAASNVNVDPFSVIEHVRKSIKLKGRLQAGDLKKIAERKERLKQEMDELEKQEEELEQQEHMEDEDDDDVDEMEMEGGGQPEDDVGGDDVDGVPLPQQGNEPVDKQINDNDLLEEADERILKNEEQALVGPEDAQQDLRAVHVDRRDTMRRVDWPGRADAVHEDDMGHRLK